MNPDTLSGAAITAGRRVQQMEARALGGPADTRCVHALRTRIAYTRARLCASASPTAPAFLSRWRCPGEEGRRIANPAMGLTGQRTPAACLGRLHRVCFFKTAGRVRISACTPQERRFRRVADPRAGPRRFWILDSCSSRARLPLQSRRRRNRPMC